tara:strand:- start:227 stop:1447 length:1221 start_codon:yes stop_codon:yes gene_type:complete
MINILNNKKFNFNLIFSYAQFAIASVFPVIVMILASRIFSVEVWGEVLLFQSSSFFFSLLILFGTEIYGLREISKVFSQKKEISKIINEVFYLRIINFLIFFLLLLILFFNFQIPANHLLIIALWTFSLIISPLWIYIALGKLDSFFFVELLIKSVTIIFIYLNISSNNDDKLLISFLIGANYFINIINIINIRKYISFSKLNFVTIKKIYKKTIPFFIIQFCANIFTSFPILIVGYILGPAQAAIFGNGERLFRIFRSLYSPINRVVLKFSSSEKIHIGQQKKGFLFAGIIGIFMFFLGFIFVIFFVENILGEKYIDSINVALILMFALPFIFISNQILHSYIYPSNNESFFMKTLLWLTPFNLIFIFSLSYFLQSNGTALSMVIAEIALFIIFLFFIRTNFKNI